MDDNKIVELFWQRSECAIKELDIKYGKLCLRTSYNILNDWSDAEECVNDSYLGVWNAIPPHKPNPLLAFTLKIVRNISINKQKLKSAKKRKGNYELCLEELEEMISSPYYIEDEIFINELTKYIEIFIDDLSVENRKLFIRRYWFMDSYKDLSIITGMTEGAIRTRLTRLREKLRLYLVSKGVEI